MNICHVTPRYAPAISGAEFYLQRMSEILVSMDSVRVHCTNGLDFAALHSPRGKVLANGTGLDLVNGVPVQRHVIDHDPGVVEAEVSFLESRLPGLSHSLATRLVAPGPCSRAMRVALQQEKADVFHVTCFPYMNVYYTLIAARDRGIPCVITPFMHPENPRYDASLVPILRGFTRILACSPSEQAFLERAGVSQHAITRVTMGVDVNRFSHVDPTAFRMHAQVSPRDFMVLFCGYKNFEKGAVTLLQALPLLIPAIPRLKLVMIGPPTTQYNMELRKLGMLKQHVININPASLSGYFDKIKLGAFSACDVYAMPSRSDAYGIAYLEAWASKKPVIASSIPAMRDLFTNGIEGLQIDHGDVEALAGAIAELHRDGQARQLMGVAGYQKILEEELTWHHVASRLRGVYENLT